MSILDDYFYYLETGFREHKFILLAVIIFAVITCLVSFAMYDEPYNYASENDAYLSQETFYNWNSAWEIISNNCRINIIMYVFSIFLGAGGIFDIIVNMGMLGSVSAATNMVTGDPFLFFKLTLVHGIPEDISTILNSFAGFLLVYFEIFFLKDASSKGFKESFNVNKKFLFQSIAVFIFALYVMVIAGLLEEFISIPVGNFIAGV